MSTAVESFWRRLRFTRLSDLLRGRVDGSLDWRTQLNEAALPPEITAVIRSVAGRRGLWHRERVAVATELIAHFQDGLDAGESAETLVASFGDARQAARLTLRAKRRCRPLWWQASWWASCTFAGFVAAYALMAVWLSFDRPAITTDYLGLLNEGIEEIPLEDRAWPIYLEVNRQLYIEKNGEEGLAEARIEFGWEPDFEEIGPEATRVWIEQHQDVLTLLRRGAAKLRLATPLTADAQNFGDFDPRTGKLIRPTSESYLQHDLINVLLGHVQSMRGYARVLEQDALIAAEEADADRAFEGIMAMLGVGGHADDSPFLISGLVAIAIDGITYELTNRLLRESSELFTDEQLKQLAHRVATLDYPAARWLEGERMGFQDIVQRLYTDDGDGDGHFTTAGMAYMAEQIQPLIDNQARFRARRAGEQALRYAAGPAVFMTFASRKEVVEKYEAIVNHLPVLLDRPLWEITPEEWHRDEAWGLPATDYEKLHFMPVELLAPGLQSVASAVERARGVREGWLIGIALELYRRENGRWPESLDELAPRWLPTLPLDRINGTPLVYQIVDGKPLVYSRGIDADDDSGRPSEDYKKTAWQHRVGPPQPALLDHRGEHPHDGDWVIWSLLPPLLDEPE